MQLQLNTAQIIFHLFIMDPSRNSTESVLIGVLGHYTASCRHADFLLRQILERIDSERSLNILSSAETWNAFRVSWFRSHVEALASSLETPFALIDSESMQYNILHFQVSGDVGMRRDEIAAVNAGSIQPDDRQLDPIFWLPIIAYSFEKTLHPSDLTLLIESSAIGYALVCLSSRDLRIRTMASFILATWENACQVSHITTMLTEGLQSTGTESDQGAYERSSELGSGREWDIEIAQINYRIFGRIFTSHYGSQAYPVRESQLLFPATSDSRSGRYSHVLHIIKLG